MKLTNKLSIFSLLFLSLQFCLFSENNTSQLKEDIIGVRQADIYEALDNIPQFLMSITTVPYYINNECVGLEVSDLDANDLARKMKIKSGDVIQSLDGVPLTDISEIFAQYSGRDISEIKVGRQFKVGLIRDSKKKVFRYQIVSSTKKKLSNTSSKPS